MSDTLSKQERSERMRRVRSKDTKPEMKVRQLVHGLGYRYRLHDKNLPGHPDLVFSSRRKLIFVHGCFWHRHGGSCPLTRWPKSRMDFWGPKLEENRLRDSANQAKLREMGWESLVIWECEVRDLDLVTERVRGFLK